jgi:magnesium-transporting ATPase (P-type)
MNIAVDESKYENGKNVEKEPSALSKEGDDEPDNHKENPDICMLTGTMIMSGGGRAVVCAVGNQTAVG